MSWISTDSGLKKPRSGEAWHGQDGKSHATVRLGQANIFFDGPEGAREARAVAAACIEAAESMERLEAETAALPAKGKDSTDAEPQ